MFRLFGIVLLCLTCVALTACKEASSPPSASNPQPSMKIGLILSGSSSDGGWNQLAVKALEKIKAESNAEISMVEKVTVAKAADEMRDYASRDYDLVIAHGYEFLVPASTVAKAGGKTRFAVSGADKQYEGVLMMQFDLSQASYQLGIIAGKMTKTNKIAFIGGAEIPPVVACFKGFEAGAKSVKPDVSVIATYTSWDRPEQSKSQAEALIQQDVDVIYQNVDAASRGVFEAIKEARVQNKTVWVFGSNSDQNANSAAGDFTLASAVIRLDRAFTLVANAVKDKTFAPGIQEENLANGVCVCVINPKLISNGTISPETLRAVEAAEKAILAGTIKY